MTEKFFDDGIGIVFDAADTSDSPIEKAISRTEKFFDDGESLVFDESASEHSLIEKAISRWPAGKENGGQFAPAKVGGMGGAQSDPPKVHAQKGENGEPIVIKQPTKPSAPETWSDATKVATFVPGGDVPAELHGVPFKPWSPPKDAAGWAKVAGQNPSIEEGNMPDIPHGMHAATGVVIVEPDGRTWLTKPTNEFGGYQHTFPKGTCEPGLPLQANAIKEAFEETGLKVEITGVFGDFKRTTSVARYYIAKRTGGTPAAMGWESQAVRLSPMADMKKLLNMPVDKGIVDELASEIAVAGKLHKARSLFIRAQVVLAKSIAATPMGSGPIGKPGYAQQPRWPQGTSLGGQWKSYDSAGITMPPKVGSPSNPGPGKAAGLLYAAAKANDLATISGYIVKQQSKADAYKAGKTNSQGKWAAGLHQYATELAGQLQASPKAEAALDKLSGVTKLDTLKLTGSKPGGSNPGGVYTDPKTGKEWLVKGNKKLVEGAVSQALSDDRAKNEVLAAKLMHVAGIGAADMKLVDLQGKYGGGLGVAGAMMKDLTNFDPKNPNHVSEAQAVFAAHAWIGNYDVLGMGFDNTKIDKTGQAVNIDPGGALLFRAQGLPKGSFGPSVTEWDTMRNTTPEQKAVFGSMTASQLSNSAGWLQFITDDQIKTTVGTYGPGTDAEKAKLAQTLIARRDDILVRAGLMKAKDAAKAPEPAAAQSDAPVVSGGPVSKPEGSFTQHTQHAIQMPTGIAALKPVGLKTSMGKIAVQQIDEAHAAGDLKGLQNLQANLFGSKPALYSGDQKKAVQAYLDAAIKSAQHGTMEDSASSAAPADSAGIGSVKHNRQLKDKSLSSEKQLSTPGYIDISSSKPIPPKSLGSLYAEKAIDAINLHADKGDNGLQALFAMKSAINEKVKEKLGAASSQVESYIDSAIAYNKLTTAAKLSVPDGFLIAKKGDKTVVYKEIEGIDGGSSVSISVDQKLSGFNSGGATHASAQDAFNYVHEKNLSFAALFSDKERGVVEGPDGAVQIKRSNTNSVKLNVGVTVTLPDELSVGKQAGAGMVHTVSIEHGGKSVAIIVTSASGGYSLVSGGKKVGESGQYKSIQEAIDAIPNGSYSAAGADNTRSVSESIGAVSVNGPKQKDQPIDIDATIKQLPISAKSELAKKVISALGGKSLTLANISSGAKALASGGSTATAAFTGKILQAALAKKLGVDAPTYPPVPTFNSGLNSDSYYAGLCAKAEEFAAHGDLEGLAGMMSAKNPGTWGGKTASSKKLVDYHAHLTKQLVALKLAETAAHVKASQEAISQPAPTADAVQAKAAPLGVAMPKLPDFDKAKLPDGNVNAPAHNAKVTKLKAMAEAGDVKGIVSLGYGTNTYGKQQAKLANDVLKAMGQTITVAPGQKPNTHAALTGGIPKAEAFAAVGQQKQPEFPQPHPATVPKAPKVGKVDPAKLPPVPMFITSHLDVKAENEGHAKALHALAAQGDLDALKAYDAFSQKSQKLTAFKEALIESVEGQKFGGMGKVGLYRSAPPIRPAATPHAALAKHAQHFPPVKVTDAWKSKPHNKIAGWVLLGKTDPSSLDSVFSKGWNGDALPSALVNSHTEKAQSFTSEQKSAIKLYVSNWAYGANDQMRNKGALSTDIRRVSKTIHEVAQDIPPGTQLKRAMNLSSEGLKALKASQPGDIIQSPQFESAANPTGHYGTSSNVQLHLITAEGVKGIYIGKSLGLGGESELLMPENTRYAIRKVHVDKYGQTIVEAVILPTVKGSLE